MATADSSSADKQSCPPPPTCCQVCWAPPMACSMPQQQRGSSDSLCSLIVDVVGILIFFLFLMLQFWFKVATYIIRSARAIYAADRVVQIALGLVGLLVLGSFLVHLIAGNRCYSHDQVRAQRKLELANLQKQGQFSGRAGSAGGAGVSIKGCVGVCDKGKATTTSSAKSQSKLEALIKPFKIALQFPKNYKGVDLNVTKTFTLAIFNQKKKKIYETTSDVKVPDGKDNPSLTMAMQPIIVSEYT